ncbi:MAG: undecaprenyldiphospho-muramoylpentapeptide beta-N-acetylglucosaminyltransferase [Eubacteriales bacterium]
MKGTKNRKIVLTGGGTAGHVTPNIALIPKLQKEGWDIFYIGSYNGIEKQLIKDMGITFYGISSGKLRRYFDLKNFTDPFRVVKGYFDAVKLINHINPSIVFSKGGFVTVPVILAAKRKKIPSIIHESDISPGLANKISMPFTTKVCATFPETLNHLPKRKSVLTGTPIRSELFTGKYTKGLKTCNFNNKKPILLIIGGSLGSTKINTIIRKNINYLLNMFQIIHICGKGNIDNNLNKTQGYKQYEYVSKNLPDLFAAADIVLSRAGANTIFELLELKKPNILVPLSSSASRGDQILNAKSFEEQKFSYVIEEENLSKDTLIQGLKETFENRHRYIDKMKQTNLKNGVDSVLTLINEVVNN